MRKVFMLIQILLILTIPSAQEIVPIKIKRSIDEPINVFPQKLNDAEYNYTKELGQYADDCFQRVNIFLKSLENKFAISDVSFLTGAWQLTDSSNNIVIKHFQFESQSMFSIAKIENEIYFINMVPPYRKVYRSKEGGLYYITTYGILKKIVISKQNIFIYILDGEYWILDLIHDGGTYFYKKTQTKDAIIP